MNYYHINLYKIALIVDVHVYKEKFEASEKEKRRLIEENEQYKILLDNLQGIINEQSIASRQPQNYTLGQKVSDEQTMKKMVILFIYIINNNEARKVQYTWIQAQKKELMLNYLSKKFYIIESNLNICLMKLSWMKSMVV